MNIKKISVFLLCALLLFGCSISHKISPSPMQDTILPEYAKNVYLGMPVAKFKEIKNLDNMTLEKGISFRIQYEETVNNDLFQSIVYYFDANISSQPLYEMIFIFQDSVDVGSYTKNLYGNPSITNHLPFDEWCWKSGEGFQIVAWTFENKLVIVGTIKKTEWGELDICGD